MTGPPSSTAARQGGPRPEDGGLRTARSTGLRVPSGKAEVGRLGSVRVSLLKGSYAGLGFEQ